MADEDKSTPAPTNQPTPSPSVQPPAESPPALPPTQTEPSSPLPPSTDRTDLLHRARAFLTSPQIRHEDASSKRRFLADKGLTDAEIDGLLYEVPPPAPALPPRTYPQPPPSRVPYLLLNVLRAFSWIAGGSAALLIAYFRFLYPKIAQTYHARLSLHSHRSALLARLTNSLEDLKTTQQSTFAVLPQPQPLREPARYAACRGLDELVAASNGEKDVPPLSLLRCALDDCSKDGKPCTSAELFRALEAKFPWVAEEGAQHEESLWRTLTTTPLFQPAPLPASPPSTTSPPPSQDTVWTYTPPARPPTPPLLASLSALSAALPPPPSPQPKFQHTFQALSDLTGYVATQTYAHGHGLRAPGFGLGLGPALAPEEEDVRREIRALKGLVLNRRAFMPRMPRPDGVEGGGVGVAAPA